MQELKPLDHRKRRDFGGWAENKIALDPALKTTILFSDEAHFWLSGYGNMLKYKSTHMSHRLGKTWNSRFIVLLTEYAPSYWKKCLQIGLPECAFFEQAVGPIIPEIVFKH